MDSMLLANRNGHIACTQGGECLAGLRRALELGLLSRDEAAILDATAHSLKFIGFQDMYFQGTFPPEYGVVPKPELQNAPRLIIDPAEKARLSAEDYTRAAADKVAALLGLKARG